MIDLYKLQIFEEVVQAGSFSAAADRLYITQSAVSQHIKDLEIGLGQQLFQRGRRGVRLTPHGETLAEYSCEIFALVRQAENALTNVDMLESGKVTVGATPGVSIYLAPEWVQRFRARYPRLTVILNTGITAQIAADVLAHRADMGIIEGELDDGLKLASFPLAEIEQMVVVGFRHPFWDRTSIRLDELNGQPFIVRQQNSQTRIWLEQSLNSYGITPDISAEFDNLESIKRMIIGGVCLTVLPSYVVQDEIKQHQLHAIPIDEKPLTRTLKLILNQKRALSPVAQAFLNQLRDLYDIEDG